MFKLQEVSRHKSVDVLAGYVRRSDLFKGHAGVGLPVMTERSQPDATLAALCELTVAAAWCELT